MGWKLPEENPGTEKRGSSPRRKERMPGVGGGGGMGCPRGTLREGDAHGKSRQDQH